MIVLTSNRGVLGEFCQGMVGVLSDGAQTSMSRPNEPDVKTLKKYRSNKLLKH